MDDIITVLYLGNVNKIGYNNILLLNTGAIKFNILPETCYASGVSSGKRTTAHILLHYFTSQIQKYNCFLFLRKIYKNHLFTALYWFLFYWKFSKHDTSQVFCTLMLSIFVSFSYRNWLYTIFLIFKHTINSMLKSAF